MFEAIAGGFLVPEGPVALADGAVLIVEVGAGKLTRIGVDGSVAAVAELGGGPNGAAIGPDGALYVCNNGGGFDCALVDGRLQIGHAPERYVGGSIQRVDLATGAFSTLYRECDGAPLLAPNDLVFDQDGGFWFTDHGRGDARGRTYGGLYYARPDGGAITRVRSGLLSPNGVGLSPDGETLYWADTLTARLWRARVAGRGRLAEGPGGLPGEVVATLPGYQLLDSLAVEAGGRVCVGVIANGGVAVFDPSGAVEHVALDDSMVTNLCFGGDDMRDVWITAAATGRLLRGRWPRAGLKPAFAARAAPSRPS